MSKYSIFIGIILMCSVASYAIACQFDSDCDIGSVCLKSGANLYGQCIGGMNPGNSNDKNPTQDNLDTNKGSTCQFDTQCNPGKHCFKQSGNINGVCM